jgi:hypothetical protein
MPSSFSRFLSDQELQRVRELFLESLNAEGEPKPAETTPAPQPDAASDDNEGGADGSGSSGRG